MFAKGTNLDSLLFYYLKLLWHLAPLLFDGNSNSFDMENIHYEIVININVLVKRLFVLRISRYLSAAGIDFKLQTQIPKKLCG